MNYPLTFYVTGRPLKSWMAGETIGPVVFIRKGYETDEGLHQHEQTHVKQAAAFSAVGLLLGLGVSHLYPLYGYLPALWGALAGQIADGLLYYFSKTYRLFAEAQAYRKQMQYPSSNGGPPLTIEQAIYYLTRDYHETLTPEQARALLT